MWDNIKAFFEKYSPIVLPAKLVAGAILGAIAGPGLLGFMSELATYRYAAAQGIRPPLEGIPYLRATVTYGSFSLLLISAALFFISLYFAGRIASNTMFWFERLRSIAPEGTQTVLERFRDLKIKYVTSLSLVVAVFFAAIGLAIGYFQNQDDIALASLALGVYGAIATFLVWRKQIAWWIASIVTLVGFYTIVSLMFNVHRYGQFLQFVGYGGGIAITVELDNPKEGTVNLNGFLILRTTQALLIFDSQQNEIHEIATDKVRIITHSSKPLMALPTKLPP